MQYVYADCVNTCTVKQKTISLLARDGTYVNNFSSLNNKIQLRLPHQKQQHTCICLGIKYYIRIIQYGITFVFIPTTSPAIVVHGIVQNCIMNWIKSMPQTIWLIHLEQSFYFRVPLLDDLHCLFENSALIFLLVHSSHCCIQLYSNPTGFGDGVVNDNLLIIPKCNMVGRK